MKEIAIRTIPENEFSSNRVITNDVAPYVEIKRQENEEGVVYSVESQLLLNRDTIDERFRTLLGENGSNWEEVLGGLRGIGLQNPRIMQLGRSAHILTHLSDIRQASNQLGDVLKRNSDVKIDNSIVAVFKYGESFQDTFEQLGASESKRLLLELKSLGFDVEKARFFANYMSTYISPTPFGHDEFLAVFENLGELNREIVNNAMMSEASGSTLYELVSRKQEQFFTGFRERGKWDDENHTVRGGSIEPDVYLRNKDIPPGVSPWRSSVSVGAEHRDPERSTDRPRYLVQFYTDQDAIYARPLLSWRKQDGERSLVFPGRPFDSPHFETMKRPVTRANSIAGAALAAAALQSQGDIDINYGKELNKMIKRSDATINARIRPGLWPIVAPFKQEELLGHEYFAAIEERLDGEV